MKNAPAQGNGEKWQEKSFFSSWEKKQNLPHPLSHKQTARKITTRMFPDIEQPHIDLSPHSWGSSSKLNEKERGSWSRLQKATSQRGKVCEKNDPS